MCLHTPSQLTTSFNPLGLLAPLSYPIQTKVYKSLPLSLSLRGDEILLREQLKAVPAKEKKKQKKKTETDFCSLELDTLYL